MSTTMPTAGTYNVPVHLVDRHRELYTTAPVVNPTCVVYRNGVVFTPTSVTPTLITTGVWKLAIAYTGLAIGDRIVIAPHVQMVAGQVKRMDRIHAVVTYASGHVQTIAANGITAAAIAPNAITATKVADGFLTAAKVAAGALNGKGDWSTAANVTAVTTAISAAITAMRGTDDDTLKTLSGQLDSAISTLGGVFEDADVAAMVTAILNAIETGLDGADLSVIAIASAVKTAIEADGSKIDHLWETTEDNAGTRRFTTASHGAVAVDVAADLIAHFETQTRAKGGVSYLRLLELLAAALVGDVSTVAGVETFEHLDGTDAFDSTAADGSRSVSLS